MAKRVADIVPNGLYQRDLVDLIYQVTTSLKGLCAKLDLDDAVVTTYEATCITAVFNCHIQDSKGHTLDLARALSSTLPETVLITPTGIGVRELVEWAYMVGRSLYLLGTALDGSAGVGTTSYLATMYTATFLTRIENCKGNSIGAGTSYTFGPTSNPDATVLADLMYAVVNCIYQLVTLLDGDATLTDTDYGSLWYTNNILLTVENTKGQLIGN